MDSKSRVVLIFAVIISISIVDQIHANPWRPKVFNVNSYGAKADETTDNSMAFLSAWKDACQWKGWSRVLIPIGKYMINSATFVGACNGPISFFIMGVIKAPTDPNLFFITNWIQFQYVDKLTIEGGGAFDGQGASAWKYNDCYKNPHCPNLPISVTLDFVTNSTIQNIKSINSKNAHLELFACKNINITHVEIIAPGDSPNTDGIKFGVTNNVHISHVNISTGDDCVAMVSGTQNIEMFNVTCGPGHGISIGSLGKSLGDDSVSGIRVRNSTFVNSLNGVRIKTWAPSSPGNVSDFTCENIFMDKVDNPIIIDQHYCPSAKCDDKAESQVQISNLIFKNIWGTSSTQVAISMNCSKLMACKNVTLVDINLDYKRQEGGGGHSCASCSNVHGSASGIELPPGCIKNQKFEIS